MYILYVPETRSKRMSINFIEVDRGRFEFRDHIVSTLEGVGPIFQADLDAQYEEERLMSIENGLDYA
jgi:hypothetical protein